MTGLDQPLRTHPTRASPQHCAVLGLAPAVKHLRTLETARGTKLIVSGWWGVARHINYTGDW